MKLTIYKRLGNPMDSNGNITEIRKLKLNSEKQIL